MPFFASSALWMLKVERVARRVMITPLALVLAFLPLLNGTFGSSHDPVRNTAAQQGVHQVGHAHEHAEEHGLNDDHTHAHNAGDHSHETAFLPPAAMQSGARTVEGPTGVDVIVPTPVRGTRLDRPPKGTVTV